MTEAEKAAAFDKIRVELERLGIDKAKIEKGELIEADIVAAIVKEAKHTQPIIDEAIKKQDALLVGKMNAQAIALGVTKESVEATAGDIKKLFGVVNEHIKTQLGKTTDENVKKLEEFSTRLREAELLQGKKEEEHKKALEDLQKAFESDKAKFQRSYAIKDSLVRVGLTDDIMKNIDVYHSVIENEVDKVADFKFENGKFLAYKKGTSDKHFKDGSSEQQTLEDIVTKRAEELKWKKVNNMNGGGNPNGGGGNQGGEGGNKPIVYKDRYNNSKETSVPVA